MVPLLVCSTHASQEELLKPGDTIRLSIQGVAAGSYEVDSGGYIALPRVGKMRASGLTHRALQQAIINAYATIAKGEPVGAFIHDAYRNAAKETELADVQQANAAKLSALNARISAAQTKIADLMQQESLSAEELRLLELTKFQLEELKSSREVLVRLMTGSP